MTEATATDFAPPIHGLTVVICTHDRESLLRRTLAHLRQALPTDNLPVRVLVIANACTDGTLDYLSSGEAAASVEGLPLAWADEPVPGKSHALNRAIRLVHTSHMAFVDDDHRVSTDFFRAIERAIEAFPQASILCGRILPDWDGTEPSWVHDDGPYRIYPLPIPRFDLGSMARRIDKSTPSPGGGNLVLRRNVFERLRAFSVELGPRGHDLGGSEDIEFTRRARDSGEYIQYVPEMVQYHYADLERLRLPYLLRKTYQRSRSMARVKHTNPGRVPRYLWRQAATYLFNAAFSVRWARSRFYLMRFSGILGQIRGSLEGLPRSTRGPA